MGEVRHEMVVCQIGKEQVRRDQAVPAELIRPALLDLIKKKHPDWDPNGYVCRQDLDRVKTEYVEDALEEEKGELTALDAEVLRSLREQETLTRNVNTEFDEKMSFGQRAADKVASFGGSWRFIGIFGGILLVWVVTNSIVLATRAFDPYPFILLNLVLSSLAAFQAPIIMMSQNRQSEKDRLQAENDYKVNLKAELEIRQLHEKIDHLLQHQWQRLLEIQQIQTELVEEGLNKTPRTSHRDGG